jgi:putative Holliday junction resolvase
VTIDAQGATMIYSGLIFGFDFGQKKIGLAKGQMITQTATPLTILRAQAGEPQWPQLDALVATWHPVAMVLGLPLNADGSMSTTAIAAQAFGELLRQRYQRPLHYMDEHLTTYAARQRSKEYGHKPGWVDAQAAQIMLESWLCTGRAAKS